MVIQRLRAGWVAALVAAGLVVAAAVIFVLPSNQRTITAYFTSAASLYEGNPVEVLGVPVGSVVSVTAEPDRVKVVMHVDDDVRVPAGAFAVQVSPSLISGRSITLAPAWKSGPLMADNAVIPIDRTEVPLDVNDLFRNVSKLSTTLGPQGVNKTGSLNRFLEVLAANLKGNGSRLAATIDGFGDATTTLAGSRDDLLGTVRGLQQFVSTLAGHDGQMRELNQRLATVAGTLASDSGELSGALQQLSTALGTVARFVADNRSLLRSNVDRLSKVTRVLVRERAVLGQILDEAPLGLGNLLNLYNAAGGTLDVRLDVNELSAEPTALLCLLINRGTPGGLPAGLSKACSSVGKALNATGTLPSIAGLLAALQSGNLLGAKK